MKTINILGIKVNSVKRNEICQEIDKLLLAKKQILICTPNTEFVMKAQDDKYFNEILNSSNINLADGMGLLWAAKFNSFNVIKIKIFQEVAIFLEWFFSLLLIPIVPRFYRTPIVEKISGSDFCWDLAEYAQKNNYKIFLLGGAPTIAERTALELQTKIYGLKITGIHSGGPKDTQQIIDNINKSKADILMVAFGAPKQEKWIFENLKKTNCKIGIGVGGSFDFISGIRKRAPLWMQKSGLEWFFRLVHEPSRLKRQLTLPKFTLVILFNKLFNRTLDPE